MEGMQGARLGEEKDDLHVRVPSSDHSLLNII